MQIMHSSLETEILPLNVRHFASLTSGAYFPLWQQSGLFHGVEKEARLAGLEGNGVSVRVTAHCPECHLHAAVI